MNIANLSISDISTLAADITTSGTQLYSGAVTLSGADRTLTGTTITTNGITGGSNGLTITGASIFNGAVTGVTNLSVSSTSTLAGNVTTSGTQTYAGAVTLARNITLTGNAISLNSPVDGAYALVINDAGMTTLGAAVGGSTPLTNLTINTAILDARDIKLATGGAFSITNSSPSSISGVIAGDGVSLTKAGAGLLQLSNIANTYSGSTSISEGILDVAYLADGGVASSIGKSSSDAANLIFNGGTLQYTGSGALSIDRLFTITTSGGAINGSGMGSGSTMNFTSLGEIVLSGLGERTFTFTGVTLNNQFHPVISDTDGGSGITTINQTGSGSWIISGGNTIQISSGYVDLTRLTSRSVIILTGDAVLDLLGQALTITKITGEATNRITNSVDSSGVVLILIGATLGNFAGMIQDGGVGKSLGLTLNSSNSSGTFTLSGSNTYSGATTITKGILVAGSANAFGISAVTIGASGKLDLQYSGTVTLSSTLNMVCLLYTSPSPRDS